MTTRADATPLSIGDRFYLMEAAVGMIEEGIDNLHEEAIEDGIEPHDEELLDRLDDLRMASYASLLNTMVNDADEAKVLMLMMRQASDELDLE